ncbi:nuclear factor 7, ovary-like [Hyperolius riggenbachi]|uniref:nuclear factor 7, ovary-like n=1 Tax=Hyperolius riggenbachi TaxID=752182 RepID=UPI0035A39565
MASVDVRRELLDCSICLSLYTDPVTLACGHNFCQVCIDRTLDSQSDFGNYCCPECRTKFKERPALQKNMTLCKIVEGFSSAQLHQKESPGLCIFCDDTYIPAVQYCLLCEGFLCDKHLKDHSRTSEHIITESGTSWGRNQVEMLDRAFVKKLRKLRNLLQKLLKKREQMQNRVQSLEERRKKILEKAAQEIEKVATLFRNLRSQLEDLENKVLSEISRQKDQILFFMSDQNRELEVKKDKLSKKICHLEELCHVHDPLNVLHDTDDCSDAEDYYESREQHGHPISNIGRLDVGLIPDTLCTLFDAISGVTKGIYMQEPADIFLDINTAGTNLHISEDLKTASWSDVKLDCPERAERFQQYPQVLGCRGFSSGRHYWEVEIKGSDDWVIGMSYPSIDRTGSQSQFGYNNKSWCLDRYKDAFSLLHDSKEAHLRGKLSCTKLKVYLDYEAGKMSFYELGNPCRHLHTFTATFTEPLHVGLRIGQSGAINILGGSEGMTEL